MYPGGGGLYSYMRYTMKGFENTKTVDVTLKRGDVSIIYTLTAPLPGLRPAILSVWPAPQLWVNNQYKGKDPTKEDAYYQALTLVMLGICMTDDLGFPVIVETPSKGVEMAARIEAEFVKANLTNGEVLTLYRAAREAFFDMADQGGSGNA